MKTRLLLLADDISGALDTGVKFSASGIDVKVVPVYSGERDIFSAEVVVLNTSARHIPGEQAYELFFRIVSEAEKEHIPYIYIKTDSALRGNVGAELEAALKASGDRRIAFIPAFPALGRTTKDGIQYFKGVPVHQSPLGNDPFDPIETSSVAGIIARQSKVKTQTVGIDGTASAVNGQETIDIYDAETEDDILRIANRLYLENSLHLMAGCAGFASALQSVMPFAREQKVKEKTGGPVALLCGSVNPVTRAQIDYAKTRGFDYFEMDSAGQTKAEYIGGPAYGNILRGLKASLEEGRPVIVSSCPVLDNSVRGKACREESRKQIADNLAMFGKELLEGERACTLMLTGGDVIEAFARRIGCREMRPMYELEEGTVLSAYMYQGNRQYMITKSGGFGRETLLTAIDRMNREEE